MKTELVAINAQYFHTALAVRSIAAYCRANGEACGYGEYTINQHFDELLRHIAGARADVYIFSCYIWNIELVCDLARELRKLYPGAVLLAGGPQVSHCTKSFLRDNPSFDATLCGEGESVVLAVLQVLREKRDFTHLPGVATGEHPAESAAPLDLDSLPFAYENLDELAGRILYYESMRGCPYRCAYCLSAAEHGVRFKSLPKVFEELERMLAAKPKQVKFVDRTFNCSEQHSMAVWRFLAERDNGFTNFHFELAGELLTEEMLAFLANIRPGLFQFEIGVQSCNHETLAAIDRPCDLDALFSKVARLQQPGNIHLHLDLIAGLPHEGYASFARSFDRVYEARPHQLQLGFLKVLPGSPLAAEDTHQGLVYTSRAPFEILQNNWFSFAQICQLKDTAAMVELYYNSGRFSHVVEALQQAFPSPFSFYEALAGYFRKNGHFDAPLSKIGQYEILGAFALSQGIRPEERLQWLCRFDLALHEKPRKVPGWVTVDGATPLRESALAFYGKTTNQQAYLPNHGGYDAKQLLKNTHIERFPFHPQYGGPSCFLLFDYSRRDVAGKAFVQQIDLEV